jgi:hypothetical protein
MPVEPNRLNTAADASNVFLFIAFPSEEIEAENFSLTLTTSRTPSSSVAGSHDAHRAGDDALRTTPKSSSGSARWSVDIVRTNQSSPALFSESWRQRLTQQGERLRGMHAAENDRRIQR